MNFTKLSVVAVFIFSLQFFAGCTKQADSPFSTKYLNMMRDNAIIHAAFDDVLKVAENIMMNNNNARVSTVGAPLSCYTKVDTVVAGVNLIKYTVNFNQGCTSYDGKVRRGAILFDLEGGNYNTTGAKLTVKFDNYSFNRNTLRGMMVVTNEGGGFFKIKISDNSGSGYASLNLYSLVKNIKWKAVLRKKIKSNGAGDNIILNNKYKIYTPGKGNYYINGITSDGIYYTANILDFLVLDNSCNATGILRYPTYGKLDFILNDIDYRTIDYGDTTDCDKSVEMIFNSTSEKYDLY